MHEAKTNDVGWGRKIVLFAPLVPALLLPGIGTLIAVVVVGIALVIFSDARRETFFRGRWLRSLGIGALCGVGIALLMGLLINPVLVVLFGKSADLSAFNAVQANMTAYVQLLILGLLYGAIVEEIIFRGFVVGWGSSLFGKRAGPLLALLSAAVFGVTHFYQGWGGVCSTGIIGFGYGLVYIASGRRLLAAIFTHMTLNAIGITELYLGF